MRADSAEARGVGRRRPLSKASRRSELSLVSQGMISNERSHGSPPPRRASTSAPPGPGPFSAACCAVLRAAGDAPRRSGQAGDDPSGSRAAGTATSRRRSRDDGPTAGVIAVDLQPKMIEGLTRRARRTGLLDGSRPSPAPTGTSASRPGLVVVDLAVVIHVLDEVRDRQRVLEQLCAALRREGGCFFSSQRGTFPARRSTPGAGSFAAGGLSSRAEKPAHRRSHGALSRSPDRARRRRRGREGGTRADG